MKASVRRAWIASILGIIPGLGHLYLGQIKKGLMFLLGFSAQAVIFWGVAGSVLATGWQVVNGAASAPEAWGENGIWLIAAPLGILILAVIWLWSIKDAWKTARGSRASLVFPVALLIILNLGAGWCVTQINLVNLAKGMPDMKEIASSMVRPDLVERNQKVIIARADIIVPGKGITEPEHPTRPSAVGPSLTISPESSQPGDTITMTGRGFPANRPVEIQIYTRTNKFLHDKKTDSRGSFKVVFVNDAISSGVYGVEARVTEVVSGWKITDTLRLTYARMIETIFLALMGTVFSIIVALPLSFFGARNLMKGGPGGRAAYSATRGVFNVLRSVEVLIIAVMLTKAVGIGPFAGVLALAIHGVGALGKLYSEAIESIDHGPIEAITATGASRLQVIAFGVVPQIVPQFISFTMYRWDINVRMATIIGMVGGGGIGFLLMQYISLLQWQQAATAIWLIAVVVMLMDYASAVIREKLV